MRLRIEGRRGNGNTAARLRSPPTSEERCELTQPQTSTDAREHFWTEMCPTKSIPSNSAR